MRGTMSEREFASINGKLAMALRFERPEAYVAELRRQVEEEQIMRAVAKAVSAAPPLTPDQIERITAILHAHATPAKKTAARKTKAARTTKRKQSA